MFGMTKLRNSPLAREFLAEIIGTFILMVIGMASGCQNVLSRGSMSTPTGNSVSWGIAVMMALYVSGGVSGGHINPAVSVAMAVLGRLPWYKVPYYCLAQYIGAFAASFFIYIVYYEAINDFDGGIRQVYGENATAGLFGTYPQPYISVWTAFGDQVFATAVLLVCVMGMSDPRNMKIPSGLFPISVGFLVMSMSMSYSLNCGNAMNPARDLAPRLFTCCAGWSIEPLRVNNYNYFWVNIVGPHIGAVVGAYVYQWFIGYHWPLEDSQDTLIGDIEQRPKVPSTDSQSEKAREAGQSATLDKYNKIMSLAGGTVNKAFEHDDTAT